MTFQWQRATTPPTWSNIDGETSTSYTLTSTDLGKYIRVAETKSGATAYSSQLGPITAGAGLPTYVNPPYSQFTQYGNNYSNLSNKDAPRVLVVSNNTSDLSALRTHQGGAHPTPITAFYTTMAVVASGALPDLYNTALSHNWFMLDTNNNPMLVYATGPPVAIIDPTKRDFVDPNWAGGAEKNWTQTMLDIVGTINATAPVPTLPAKVINGFWYDNALADYRGLEMANRSIYQGYKNNNGVKGAIYDTVYKYASEYIQQLRIGTAELQRHGYYVIGNADSGIHNVNQGTDGPFVYAGIDGGAANNPIWWDMLVYDNAGPWRPGSQIFDAHMIEHWMWIPQRNLRRIGSSDFTEYWRPWTDLQLDCQARTVTLDSTEGGGTRPLGFHGHAQGTNNPVTTADKMAELYSYVSFLLNWNGSSGQSVHEFELPDGNSYGTAYGTNVWLGEPTDAGHGSAKYEVQAGLTANSNTPSSGSNIWRRDFSNNHFVILNPTYSTVTFTSGDWTGTLVTPTGSSSSPSAVIV